MARCNRPDCGRGVIDEQGFCVECDRRPLPEAAEPAPPGGSGQPGASVGVARVRTDPWWGLELVRSDTVPEFTDPPSEEHDYVGAEHRYCAKPGCRQPVGREHDGRPGRAAGYCANCGTPFDFTRPGDGQTRSPTAGSPRWVSAPI